MKLGTKSVLFGAHQFLLHPLMLAAAWWKLYGFPFDPRLWVAFFVHDLGYLGKPNMDGPEGKAHPELGARIMSALFDERTFDPMQYEERNAGLWRRDWDIVIDDGTRAFLIGEWGQFALFHSRSYARMFEEPVSRLCAADKLATAITPAWLYVPLVLATGEIEEYFEGSASIPYYTTNTNLIALRQAAIARDAWAWKRALDAFFREEARRIVNTQAHVDALNGVRR